MMYLYSKGVVMVLLVVLNLTALFTVGNSKQIRAISPYLPNDVVVTSSKKKVSKEGRRIIQLTRDDTNTGNPHEKAEMEKSNIKSDMNIPQMRDIETRRSLFKLQEDFVEVCYGNLTSPEAIQDGNITTIDVYNFINLVDEEEYSNFNAVPPFVQLEWTWTLCPPIWIDSAKCFEELEEMNEEGYDYGFLLNPDNTDSVFNKVKEFCKQIWYVYRTTGKFFQFLSWNCIRESGLLTSFVKFASSLHHDIQIIQAKPHLKCHPQVTSLPRHPLHNLVYPLLTSRVMFQRQVDIHLLFLQLYHPKVHRPAPFQVTNHLSAFNHLFHHLTDPPSVPNPV
jgi:hypothetical protein